LQEKLKIETYCNILEPSDQLYSYGLMVSTTVKVFCLLSFTLTIDYSLSLISAQAYWTATGGDKNLAGLIFGLYDASTIVVTPLLAYYLEKSSSPNRYKNMFIVGLVTNMLGNLVYAFAYSVKSWLMILLGRLVSGIGATVLPLLMVYVSDNLSEDEQAPAVGYIKYVSAISRVMGPVLGSVFSATIDDNGTIGKFFNMYTLVGWIPVLLCLVTLYVVHKYFEEEGQTYGLIHEDIGLYKKVANQMPILWIGFTSTFIYWMFMGNSFIVATHHYHLIKNEHNLGRIYFTGFIGFILSFVLFLINKKAFATLKSLCVSVVLLVVGLYVYLASDNWTFYLAVGLSTLAYGLMIPSLNIINNLIARLAKAQTGNNTTTMIILLSISQSIARFCGPSAFAIFTSVDEHTNCDFSDPDNYVTNGCTIKNYVLSNSIFISSSFAIMMVSMFALNRKINRLNDRLLANVDTN
jgi:MFS family permease